MSWLADLKCGDPRCGCSGWTEPMIIRGRVGLTTQQFANSLPSRPPSTHWTEINRLVVELRVGLELHDDDQAVIRFNHDANPEKLAELTKAVQAHWPDRYVHLEEQQTVGWSRRLAADD